MGYHLDMLGAIWAKQIFTNLQRGIWWMGPYLHPIVRLSCSATLVWECQSGLILGRLRNHIWTCFLTMVPHSSSESWCDLYSQSWSRDTSGVLKLFLPQDKGLDGLCNSLLRPTPKTPPFEALLALVTHCHFQWDIGIWLKKIQTGTCMHIHMCDVDTHSSQRNSSVYLWIALFTIRNICLAWQCNSHFRNKEHWILE